MSARSTARRMAIVCAGTLAVIPLTAGAASAQSADDFCDEVPEELEAVFGPLCEAFEDDGDGDEGDDEDGPTGTPLDELLELADPEQLAELCEQAPEELEAVFGPICEALTGDEGDEDEGDEPEAETPETESEELPATAEAETDTGDTADATADGELPRTGGLAGLAGLGLLGTAAALARRPRDPGN